MPSVKTRKYRWLSHTADAGAVVHGRGRRTLFQNATVMFADLVSEASSVVGRRARRVSLKAASFDLLFARYLKELLFLFETRQFLAKRLRLHQLTNTELRGEILGETFDPARHPFKTEVKAVTYHQLAVKKTRTGYRARVIFDL